jgi:hypothetical protein
LNFAVGSANIYLEIRRTSAMKKRRYGRQTTRIPRATNTDRLNACKTWEEVQSCPLYDDWIKTISFKPGIYHPKMEAPDPIETNLSRARYEVLCDIIDNLLTKEEQKIFYGIAEESKSLRVVAKELNCSYEKVRQVFIRCQNKIKENPDVQRIQSGSDWNLHRKARPDLVSAKAFARKVGR